METLLIWTEIIALITDKYVWILITARKRSLGQGNIFTGVFQSFCSHGGGISVWCLFLSDCLVLCSFWEGGLAMVPCSFQGGSPSRGSLSRWGLCPWGLCPWGLCLGVLLSRRPPRQRPLYGEERVVRILLECILVYCIKSCFSFCIILV